MSGIPVTERLSAMDRERIVARIWGRDHTVWGDDPAEISDRLGWLTVTDSMRGRVGELESFADDAAADGFETTLLLGMGGSSLAPEVFMRTFDAAPGALELIVLDTTHPAAIERITTRIDLARTLFVVASKSGTTIETRSHLAHFWDLDPDGARFVAITDPGTPLEELARDRAFRRVFLNPGDIGGRYSALSYFGLVPAALIGAPLGRLLDRADEIRRASELSGPAALNPGAVLGATIGEAARAGRDKLTLLLPGEIASFGDWVEQLVAESTGKEGVGIVPIVGEPLGDPGDYGPDRVFVVTGAADGVDGLEQARHPVVRLELEDREDLGGEIFRWQLATAVAGHVLGINPFDQPNVQEAKDATNQILAAGGFEDPGFDELGPLLGTVGAGDYVAVTAFVDPTPETVETLERVRLAIRDRTRAATTVGFGPRYLHSTGQLHKGGANNGVFVQVVDGRRHSDVPIPERDLSFGRLIDAQALGDLRSLRARGRRVARVTLDALREVI